MLQQRWMRPISYDHLLHFQFRNNCRRVRLAAISRSPHHHQVPRAAHCAQAPLSRCTCPEVQQQWHGPNESCDSRRAWGAAQLQRDHGPLQSPHLPQHPEHCHRDPHPSQQAPRTAVHDHYGPHREVVQQALSPVWVAVAAELPAPRGRRSRAPRPSARRRRRSRRTKSTCRRRWSAGSCAAVVLSLRTCRKRCPWGLRGSQQQAERPSASCRSAADSRRRNR